MADARYDGTVITLGAIGGQCFHLVVIGVAGAGLIIGVVGGRSGAQERIGPALCGCAVHLVLAGIGHGIPSEIGLAAGAHIAGLHGGRGKFEIRILSPAEGTHTVFILVFHIGLHDAVDGESVCTVALIRNQPDRQRVPLDGDRLARQLRSGVLCPIHIDVVYISLHLCLRREGDIQGNGSRCLVGIGSVQVILIIMAGLRIPLLVQGLCFPLVHIDFQLSGSPPVGNVDGLCPGGGHVAAAQLQQPGIIENSLRAAVLMGQCHAQALGIQGIVGQVRRLVNAAGRGGNRLRAVAYPGEMGTAGLARTLRPLAVVHRVKCVCIIIAKGTRTNCGRIPCKYKAANISCITEQIGRNLLHILAKYYTDSTKATSILKHIRETTL